MKYMESVIQTCQIENLILYLTMITIKKFSKVSKIIFSHTLLVNDFFNNKN